MLRVIGYLARICEDKGLHLLVEACEQLAKRTDLPPFVLHAAGYLGEGDRPYLATSKPASRAGPFAGRFQYVGELDRARKDRVPAIARRVQHADRLSRIERPARARSDGQRRARRAARPRQLFRNGRRHRRRPVASAARSGRLADKLAELLRDPVRATQLGLAGQQAIQDRYHATAMARQTLELYRQRRLQIAR